MSDARDPGDATYARRLAGLLIAGAVVRLLFAASTELVADEAYYYAWSQRLAWGYLDHPPMVAWLIAASTACFGVAEWSVRLPAVLCGAVTAGLAAAASRRLGASANGGLFVAAALTLAPLGFVGGALITPDAPLAAFWAATLYFAIRGGDGSAPRWILAAGVTLGLAVLSKLTALILGLALLIVALRGGLARQPTLWAAVVVALALSAPYLLWSLDAAGGGFAFQARRLGGGFDPRYLPEMLGGQAGLLGPVLFLLLLGWVWRHRRGEISLGLAICWWSCALPLLLFAVVALTRRVEANWLGPTWIGALCAVAATVRPRWARARYSLGAAAAITLLALAQVWWTPLPLGSKDPTARLRGHRAAAQALAARHPTTALFWVPSYQQASLLRFYLPPGRSAWSVGVGWRGSQYDLWEPPALTPVLLLDDALQPKVPDSVLIEESEPG